MKRLLLFAAAPLLLSPLWAEDIVVSTRIYTEPELGWFYVDGHLYQSPATFLWPEGSKHILSATAPPPQQNLPGWIINCANGDWTDSLDHKLDGPTIAITAHHDITWYKTIGCTKTCLVELQFYNEGDPNPPFQCIQGPEFGKVYVNGACYAHNALISGPPPFRLQAYPPRGFVFLGWSGNSISSQAYEAVANSCPGLIYARFAPAVGVTILTSPPGMQVLVDRAVVTSPAHFDWVTNSTHDLAPVVPQRGKTGGLWAFDSWAHGGDPVQTYTVGGANVPVTLTARYGPAVQVELSTRPIGLKLNVDGADYAWNNRYSFLWVQGSKHKIAAPAQQADKTGRQFGFKNWSLGEAPEHEIVAGKVDSAVAYYEALGRVTVQAAPADVQITVDGTPCKTPCVIDRRAGTEVRLAAPASIPMSDGVRLEFQSWSDGGAREHAWMAGTDVQTLTATYVRANRLVAVADPQGGASFQWQPASPDGYYPAGSEVKVTVQPNPGFKFTGWDGGTSGISRTASLKADGPVVVRALLQKVPYIAPAGVRNAAGVTPEQAVAPGSIISIYGGMLASGTAQAPGSPLPQALGGVSVQAGDHILPLFYISPEQINAQLPSGLEEGDQTLTVQPDAQPSLSTRFSVQRNAPGLFTRLVEDQQFALATHPDGSLVTLEHPAQRGEIVTLLGTGFGPYHGNAIDGFAVPDGLVLTLADTVEIRVGDRVVAPESAEAAPGMVGITAIRLRIDDSFPTGATIEINARVNGHDSNRVLLPLN